ncbi:hypothetical protein O3G_MSEX007266 [Manduca sexta]|uniref:ATP-dependent RNA helicase n=1 Tax=Manduca sexta TaxID=7130 RepID=A0A921Z6W0_MANSE|nr:hypothetical protein O3G_MSEX007266 [Manduca sexta]
MSKKLHNLKWETVALEGVPTDNLQGFIGLEECTDYGMDRDSKRAKKKKEKEQTKKRKQNDNDLKVVPNKKVKLSNGFIVESCNTTIPSKSNEVIKEPNSKKKKQKKDKNEKKNAINKDNMNKGNKKVNKPKLGEDITQTQSNLTPEDMLTWAEFKLPESIMKALTELGFKKPTKIQELTLPAAIHGRRDILGAAETGSGKTLAFALPILSGILKLKEKAEAKGLDVYDIPYKKVSVKKKNVEEAKEILNNKQRSKGINRKDKKPKINKSAKTNQGKESSEDGYGSGDDSDDQESGDEATNADDKSDEEYLEEIEVPLRKKKDLSEEDDSDDENYVHLSEMIDSDDLAESDEQSEQDDNSEMDDESVDSGEGNEEVVENASGDDVENDESGTDEEAKAENENAGNEKSIGLVKMIDNVEIPGHVVVKTGKPLYALILTPTRELAIQISRHIIAAAKYTGIRVATIVGGMAAVKQERVLRCGPEIVVATPGRLWELVNQGQPHLQQLSSVKFLAIDETDRMVERGHFEELQPLLERLNAEESRRDARQNFVFSATLTMVHELPAHLKGKKVTKRGKILNRKIQKMTPKQKIDRLVKMIGMTDPKVVDITATNLGTAETLTESRIACSLEDKDPYLYYILRRHPGRTIVFCNSIGSVKRLAQLLTSLKCKPLPLHANMQQRQRLKNLERFRDDPRGVLVATDVAARGLDVPHVAHVVHYQVPRTAENYVHRSGRTARATREGLTILMMEPAEAYLYGKLCATLNKTSEVPTFPVPAHNLAPLKEVVKLARDLDALELRRRRAAQSVGWRDKAAREMDIIVDDDDLPVKQVDPSIDKAIQAKKKQLEYMLSRPMFPKGFSFKYPTLNDPTALNQPEEKALQVMKKAIESGAIKKDKRRSKNESLFKLEKAIKKNNKNKKK